MAQDEIAQVKASNSNWLWLASLGTFGVFALSSGKSLLAAGFVLLGLFAFFNNPMKINEPIPGAPKKLLLISWACGLAGVLAVLSAAFASWT